MRIFYCLLLLTISNLFMTFAWYGHLQFKKMGWFVGAGVWKLILISWGIALIEYIFQVPANRMGSEQLGGPFSLMQLKTIQEVISLVVFALVSVYVFKSDTLKWNHLAAFACLVGAVYFVFRK